MGSAHLLCAGFGYTASHLVPALIRQGWRVTVTSRAAEKCAHAQKLGCDAQQSTANSIISDVSVLGEVTHILHSIPPRGGDPFYEHHLRDLKERAPQLRWFGYLSTTGVYGDHQGAWVDEQSATRPTSERSRERLVTEQRWLASGLPVQIFRLSGIYGPGRSAIDEIRAGDRPRCIEKAGHAFSRIHVEDIAAVLAASLQTPKAGEIFNVADDLPAPQAEVMEYAYQLCGVSAPSRVPYNATELSEMAQSFWRDNRKVLNQKIKQQLGISLRYPTYKEGLRALV